MKPSKLHNNGKGIEVKWQGYRSQVARVLIRF